MSRVCFLTLFIITLCACNSKHRHNDIKQNHALKIDYAQGFDINYYDDYKEVIVYNPWEKNEVLQHYYLVKDEEISVPGNGQKIVIPLQSIGATSSTHFEFLFLLKESWSITGISSPELVYNEEIRKRFNNGKIKNLGEAFNLNFEHVLLLMPDALMISGFNQNNEIEKRFIQAGLPVIYNNEWTETSLLGRAEWIKFVAAFYDKEKLADSIFTTIAENYTNLKKLTANVVYKPSVMSGSNFKGTWYMPGGKSYMGQLYKDAGADYYLKNDSTKNSLPLNFEVVLKNFQSADYWLGCSADTMKELLSADERYALFSATQKGNVYNLNNRVTTTGGNDFWESGVAHPDRILSDVIKILHPQLLPEYQLYYMKKVE